MAIKTIKILDENPERYTLKPNTKCLGRMWDRNSEQINVLFPPYELEKGTECFMVVYADGKQIESIAVQNNAPFYITNVLSRHNSVQIGFVFEGENDYSKNSEFECFYFAKALKPTDFVPDTPTQLRLFTKLVENAFVSVDWSESEHNELEFKNLAGEVVAQLELSPFVQEQADLAEDDPNEESFVRNKSTKYLQNEGEDGSSPYATESYVNTYGGKIDIVKKNGTALTIDPTDKSVNVLVPTNTVQTSSVISISGDNATLTNSFVNLDTQATSSDTATVPLANDTTAGLMSYSDYNQIRNNTSRISALEGKTTRLLYSRTQPAEDITITSLTRLAVGSVLRAGSILNGTTLTDPFAITSMTTMDINDKIAALSIIANGSIVNGDNIPTATDINAFVTALGYTSPFEGIGVVTAETYHIWHFYENNNIGWRDDGVDTVSQFTNEYAGVIKGAAQDGRVYAETDGTGSVYGWDTLKGRVTDLENNSVTKNIVAETFSEQNTYAVGDIVFYNNALWICNTAITTAGTWDDSKWSPTTIETLLSAKANKVTISDYTLNVANWSNNTYTLIITGKTANNHVLVSNSNTGTNADVLANSQAIASANIYKITDNGTSITLICENTPTADIKIQVEVFD